MGLIGSWFLRDGIGGGGAEDVPTGPRACPASSSDTHLLLQLKDEPVAQVVANAPGRGWWRWVKRMVLPCYWRCRHWGGTQNASLGVRAENLAVSW